MRRRHALLLAAVIALTLVTWLRIVLIGALHDQGYFAKYIVFADRILAGHIPRDRLTDLSPGYLWLIVGLRGVGAGFTAIRTMQIVSLSVAAFLCALAARRLGTIAMIAAPLLLLANRAAFVIATELEPETLIVLALAAALAALARWEEKRTISAAAMAGVCIGLAMIGRPVAAVTVLLIAAWMILRDRRSAILFIAAALVPVVIVLAVNGTLAGQLSIMEPGTGLYDGNNALATGCAGVLPRIVADLDAASGEPDFLHVAYRLVAARATGTPPSPRISNRYWSGKAMQWMRSYPSAAARLFAWKALLSIHNYDVYDLSTTRRKAGELSRWPAASFGFLASLALAGLVLSHDRRALIPAALFCAATVAALIVFNVSARQRDALLPPLTILAAAGAAEVARRKDRAAIAAALAVIAGTLLLGIEITPAAEDAYAWQASFVSARALDDARAAFAHGAVGDSLRRAAAASIFRTADPPSVPPGALLAAAREAVRSTTSPPILFDAALAMEKANDWAAADRVLAAISDYTPRRENRAVSSVAFYRARAALHTGGDPKSFLQRAAADAPGDPDVLAALALHGDREAAAMLDRLHDPFTRDFALAMARLDAGDRTAALALRERLLASMPEWKRPAAIR
jgi:hypothetical protein